MNNNIKPNERNSCSGRFDDWLEINLIEKCNARCPWCIERDGLHPKEKATWNEIADAAIKTGKKNIILLGGEPTLYPHIQQIISYLHHNDRNVYMTTNGSKIDPYFIRNYLNHLTGVNISIHHHDLDENKKITGLYISIFSLQESIIQFQLLGIKVRLNCNCIKGHIDSKKEILNYIKWAKMIGVTDIRFAELKGDESFVDLAKVFKHQYGLNDDPFTKGCNQDAVIDGVNVNFRQMCGFQTLFRPKPDYFFKKIHKVLYYDGKLYDGWQKDQKKEQEKMEKKNSKNAKILSKKEINQLLVDVRAGKVKASMASKMIASTMEMLKWADDQVNQKAGGFCRY